MRDFLLGIFIMVWGLFGCLSFMYYVDGNIPLAGSNAVGMLVYAWIYDELNKVLP